MSIRFDNNADRFRWTSNLPAANGGTPWTIALKCRVESDLGSGLQEVLRLGHSTNSDAAAIVAWDSGSNVMEIVSYEDNTGTLNVQSFASRPAIGKWFWLTVSCEGTGANQLTGRWSYEDNVNIVSASTTLSSPANQAADNLWLGSTSFTDRCDCTIAYAGYVLGTAWNDAQHLSNKFATTAWSGAAAFITTATDGVDQSGNGNDATVSGLSAGTGEPMTTDMSFVASRGTGTSSTNNSTLTVTPSATIAAGQLALIAIAADNTGTSDTASGSEVSGVADTQGNSWTKIGEIVNGSPGAGAGIVIALFGSVLSTPLTTSDTVTVTFASDRTDKCCGLMEHNWPSGQNFQVDAINSAEATTNGFGSAAISGLASADRLYSSAGGKEANSTTALTATSLWTNYGFTVRSRNNAAAVLMRAEFIGRTSTGETSNPTMAVSGDAAHIIAALSPSAGTELKTASDTLLPMIIEGTPLIQVNRSTVDSLLPLLSESPPTILGALNRTDSLAVLLSETTAILTTLGRTDTVLIGLSDSVALNAIFAANDTLVPLLEEASSVIVAVTGSDTALIALSEGTVDLRSNVLVVDTASITFGEAVAILSTLARNDAILVTLDEASTILTALSLADSLLPKTSETSSVMAALSRSDTLLPTLAEAVTILSTLARSDDLLVLLSEGEVDLFKEDITEIIDKSASDTLLPKLTEGIVTLLYGIAVSDSLLPKLTELVQVQSFLSRTDNLSLTLAETVTLLLSLSRSDSVATTLTETASVLSLLQTSDNLPITVQEAVTILSTLQRSDTCNLTVSEAVRVLNSFVTADQILLATNEASAIQLAKDVFDSLSINLSEVSDLEITIVNVIRRIRRLTGDGDNTQRMIGDGNSNVNLTGGVDDP